ncbi:MAG: hypothetical protein EZS28_045480 [Streblomastix strix]|uniref:Uncharacterized protein n=1 Tax=Streblomastix strix TaxID=222440 RepID=A0A5J4TMI8_9EUKA|nr:MAG: hypothetical protein EZS28_045480 [Streblomastix strix]
MIALTLTYKLDPVEVLFDLFSQNRMDSQGIPPTTQTRLTDQPGLKVAGGREKKIKIAIPPMKRASSTTPFTSQHHPILRALWGHQSHQVGQQLIGYIIQLLFNFLLEF